ncbi:MAG: histidine kinase [Flaviaesturariibacter sp.]|nr:histidine kinase [Flaviaesturariibacter sp.]
MNHTVFFLGMAVLQVVFITYQYALFKRKEYVYYILYSLLISSFVCYKSFPQYNPFRAFVTPTETFTAGRSFLVLAYGMYFRFGRHFTETMTYHKGLDRMLHRVEQIFIGYGLLDLASLIVGLPYQVLELPTRLLFLASIPFFTYVIFFLITRRRRLTTLLVVGSALLLFCGSAGFIDQAYVSKTAHDTHYYIGYLEAGICAEFLFLNYGLIYKTRMIQKENLRLEVEKQVELYKHRVRISNDLHDEVGATLSGIALYSQLTKHQISLHLTEKVSESLDRMQESAIEMVEKLSDIVWSVNPDQDSFEKLLQRLDDYLRSAAMAKGIDVSTSFAPIPPNRISMDVRRQTYLLLKEAINNAIKYSAARQIRFSVSIDDGHLVFEVADNGKGFDPDLVKRGNGLNSISRRAGELNAALHLASVPGKGTTIRLSHSLVPI